MELLHTTFIVDQKYATDASIWSMTPVTPDGIEQLADAQEIVEAQFLGGFPCVVALGEGSKIEIEDSTLLYGRVRLLHIDAWEKMDTVDSFLVNSKMLQLCKMTDTPFINLDIVGTGDGLQKVFETNVFAVAVLMPNVVCEADWLEIDCVA